MAPSKPRSDPLSWPSRGGRPAPTLTTAMLEIRVIGELEIHVAGKTAQLPPSRRARALLAWLAVHPGRHARSRLAGLFWPDVLEASARASLRSAIWVLRPALGPDFGSYLAADRDTVALAGHELRVDLREVRQLLARGEPEAAIAWCRGDLLQDLDDDWVITAREELAHDIAAALQELTQRAVAAADPAAAVTWARRRAALCPLDESAGAGLVRALIGSGDGPGALEAFDRLQQRLGSELGIAVSAATAALVAPLRQAAAKPAPAGPGGDAAPAPATAGLIGRDRELARLAAAWHAARNGAGGAVLLEGEGGIGKTRLVQELQAAAGRADPGARLVSATAPAGPGPAAPFAIWADALTDLVTMAGPPASTEPWAADLAAIVPVLAYGAAVGREPIVDPQLRRVKAGEAVVQLLSWAAARSPLLIALEDLHLADPASLELLAYAGRRLGALPVLLVLSRRRLPARPDLDATLDVLRSRGALTAEIPVGPLTDDAVRAVITSVADLPGAAVAEIVQLAGGRPLLAAETARAASSAAAAGPAAAGLTMGVTGAVRIALGRLSAQARLFAEFAATAGRPLDRPEIDALPLPNAPRAAAEALGSGLFTTAHGRTGYRHALLRDAVYQDLPDPIRARLHSGWAQVLRRRAQQARSARRGDQAAEIARHLRLGGQDEQAVAYLVRAAAQARLVAAMPAAAAFLTEALQIEPGDHELLVELAEVEAFRGLLASSDDAFDQALQEIAPQDSGALASAWLRRGRWLRGGICHPRESRRSYRSALDVLDRDPESDRPARACALAGMAWAEAVAGDVTAVDELLARADRALGGQDGGVLLAHDIGVARGHALIRAGRFTDSFGPLVAASAAAGRAGRPDMAYGCLSNAASAAACAGQFDRALDFADRCLPLVVPNGLLGLAVYTQTARSAILRRLSRLPEARQACAAAAGYADRVGLASLDGLVRHELGLLALAASDPVAAARDLASALELGAPVSRAGTRLRLAEALARSGQPGPAEAELRGVALEPVSPSDFPATLVAQLSRVQGLIAAARGDTALAERRLAEALGGWQRVAAALDGRQAGAGYVAALIDLGRPPVSSLIEPDRELAAVSADLSALRTPQE
jgi:DNA-binding SARP family transcriptional activator